MRLAEENCDLDSGYILRLYLAGQPTVGDATVRVAGGMTGTISVSVNGMSSGDW